MFESNARPYTSTNAAESRPVNKTPFDYGAVRAVNVEDENSDLNALDNSWDNSWDKGGKIDIADDNGSEPVYRDVAFSALFVMHLLAMLFLGIFYGSWTIDVGRHKDEEEENELIPDDSLSMSTDLVIFLGVPCSAVSFFLTFIVTSFYTPKHATFVVTSSLVLSVASIILICLLLCTMFPFWYTILSSFTMVAVTVYYVMILWKFIPFAATNLAMSIKGISSNCGIYFIAIVFSTFPFIWTFFTLYVANGSLNSEKMIKPCEEDDPDCAVQYKSGGSEVILWGILLLSLISLYWTCTVMSNIIQVTVAGVMGTWCFNKTNASTCCSPAVTSSLHRSITFSFGSICFGSLFGAIVTAFRILTSIARNQDRNDDNNCSLEDGILVCIIECILSLIKDPIEYFNRWTYVYVGIYGHSYIKSGKGVIELFRARGWTLIATYDLVSYTLNFIAVQISICSGLAGVAIIALGYIYAPTPMAFCIGFIFGFFISSAMMNVIKKATNTLIVCYADSPAMLEESHPELAQEIAKAWISAFPDCRVILEKEPIIAVSV
uniref:Choline transporter-like protein n=1 Tax=Ditylum brightwellii TaxID=49249 RepID=A0A7S1ZHT6_9STRA|mmetsp:Transcript_31785/g.47401  ORF Transcript_31785/g.47401 Transcript_31785/m.47401 type:complete len:549 (+) Transcript_31785:192-1838(+)